MDEKDQEVEQADSPDIERENFTVTFGKREIEFKQPTEGQVAVIARGARKAQRGGGANTVEAIGLILDVLDRLVVRPDDRDWLENGLIDGTLKLDDFLGVLEGINSSHQAEEESKSGKKGVKAARARSGRR